MTWSTAQVPTRRESYEKLRDDLLEIRQRIEDIEATADSRDGLVSATVVGRGELTELYLDPRIYRTMDSKALASSIVDTMKDAVEQAREQLFEITRRYLPPGAKLETTDVHTDPFMHRGRKGERRSFAETDYASLLDAAHQQLGGPIVLIWDNLNTHVSVAMRELIAARDWLHVIRLPPYAPDLNPAEHVWSHVKRGLGNLIVHGIDQLVAVVKNRLKRIQYRPKLLDAFLAHTGLKLHPELP